MVPHGLPQLFVFIHEHWIFFEECVDNLMLSIWVHSYCSCKHTTTGNFVLEMCSSGWKCKGEDARKQMSGARRRQHVGLFLPCFDNRSRGSLLCSNKYCMYLYVSTVEGNKQKAAYTSSERRNSHQYAHYALKCLLICSYIVNRTTCLQCPNWFTWMRKPWIKHMYRLLVCIMHISLTMNIAYKGVLKLGPIKKN